MIRFLKCQQSKEWDIIYSTWCYRSQLWRILWLCWHHSGWFLIFCSADKLKYLPRFTAVPARVCPELPIFTTINSTAHAKTSVRTLLVYSKPREVQTAREATAERCCKGSWALTAHKNSRANRPITAKEHPLSCFIPSTSATNPVRKSADCSSRGRVNHADHRLQVYLAFSAVLYQFSQIKQRFFFFFPWLVTFFLHRSSLNSCSVSLLLLALHYQDCRAVTELPVPTAKGIAQDRKGSLQMLAKLSRTVHSTGSKQFFSCFPLTSSIFLLC